jgi:hypothetical protein
MNQLVEIVTAQGPVTGSMARIIGTVFLDKLLRVLGIPRLLELICGILTMAVQTITSGRTEFLTRTTLAVMVTGSCIVKVKTRCSSL